MWVNLIEKFDKVIEKLNHLQAYTLVGSVLHIPFITKHQAGAYLCIASVSAEQTKLYKQTTLKAISHFQNGIPPTVSKRITVIVNCEQQQIIWLVKPNDE